MASILEIKEDLIRKAKRGIFLDVDDTLVKTAVAWFIRALRVFGNPENLSAEAMWMKYKLVQNVPYWPRERVELWMERVMRPSGHSHYHVDAIHSAKLVLRRIRRDLGIVSAGYLTARPAHLANLTRRLLDKHGFPALPILMRETVGNYGSSHEWKAAVLDLLYPQVIGIVDDHPEVAKALRARNYPGTVFLYNHEVARDDLVEPCPQWSHVYHGVKRRTGVGRSRMPKRY